MVDIGAGTLPPSSVEHFDRSRFPVKYYYTDLSSAVQDDHSRDAYIQDVKECGIMIERLLSNVRPVRRASPSLTFRVAAESRPKTQIPRASHDLWGI